MPAIVGGYGRRAVLAHAGEVKLNSFFHQPFSFLARCAGCDAARQVWDMGAVSRLRLFVYDRVVLHYLRSACLRIVRSPPGAMSSPGCPGIVTRPGLVGCLYWQWLPLRL